MWQKEVPARDGYYWVADYKGNITGPKLVAYDGKDLVWAGGRVSKDPLLGDDRWLGLWWSIPVDEPRHPSTAELKLIGR